MDLGLGEMLERLDGPTQRLAEAAKRVRRTHGGRGGAEEADLGTNEREIMCRRVSRELAFTMARREEMELAQRFEVMQREERKAGTCRTRATGPPCWEKLQVDEGSEDQSLKKK